MRDHNVCRGRVDVLDQLHSYYPILRKSRRWWPRLAWWLIDAAICNAHRLYQVQINEKCSGLDFRTKLMHALVGDSNPHIAGTRRASSSSGCSSQNQHWPIHVEEQGRCWYCYHVKNIVPKPRIKCEFCDKYLCIDPCFKLYHRACDVE